MSRFERFHPITADGVAAREGVRALLEELAREVESAREEAVEALGGVREIAKTVDRRIEECVRAMREGTERIVEQGQERVTAFIESLEEELRAVEGAKFACFRIRDDLAAAAN
jgi:F0F1-type ATP synthase membrane subunit b/b'